MNHKIIEYRLRWKSDRLKNGALSKSPDLNIKDQNIVELNIRTRKWDLANALYDVYVLNKENKELYGTSLVKFACNQLIKSWPWIDGKTENEISTFRNTDINYLEDLFLLEDVSSDDFYYYIDHFQQKHGESWRTCVSRKRKTKISESNLDIHSKVSDMMLSKKHLSNFLFSLYKVYQRSPELYGQIFKAYFGNWIVREWPRKDLAFTSLKYNKSEKSIYEHYTPISFFRDMLDDKDLNRIQLSEKDFYDALVYFYRVIYLHKETEDDELNKRKFKTSRPVNAYQICGIKISEEDLWNQLYAEFDNKVFNIHNC